MQKEESCTLKPRKTPALPLHGRQLCKLVRSSLVLYKWHATLLIACVRHVRWRGRIWGWGGKQTRQAGIWTDGGNWFATGCSVWPHILLTSHTHHKRAIVALKGHRLCRMRTPVVPVCGCWCEMEEDTWGFFWFFFPPGLWALWVIDLALILLHCAITLSFWHTPLFVVCFILLAGGDVGTAGLSARIIGWHFLMGSTEFFFKESKVISCYYRHRLGNLSV